MIGILGAGQLGRMLALAGIPLGEQFRFLDPDANAPARQLGTQIVGAFDDDASLQRLAAGCSVVTYEFENIPVAAAERLAATVLVYPPPAALRASQDRVDEKTFLNAQGIRTAPWFAVNSQADLVAAVTAIGAPGVLKTRRMGYDGKGQIVLRTAADVEQAWTKLGGQPLIYEGFVRFDRELSCIGVRDRTGNVVCYPLIENWHHEGILRLSIAPGPNWNDDLQQQAVANAKHVMAALDYVGVLTVEYFQCGSDLVCNEMAPRVHNSGHWSIEGAVCSQFENHVRAIAGLPLGSTAVNGAAAMLNLIGDFPDLRRVLNTPGVHLHHYGKEPRLGRKIGHLTVVAPDHATLTTRITELRRVTGLDKLPPWPM